MQFPHRRALSLWLLTCIPPVLADPLHAQIPAAFSEEAALRGVAVPTPWFGAFGAGISAADLDGDLDPDLVITRGPLGKVGFFENDGTGYFTERLVPAVPLEQAISAVVAGDYDGDGDLDLYFSCWGCNDLLFRNEGDFVFTDQTAAAGLGAPGPSTGCAFGDYDGDGWLDLYVSRYGQPGAGTNLLYRNQGDGTFVDMAAALGILDPGFTFQGIFFDVDQDQDPDLYVSNDKGQAACAWHNHLYENVGGAFIERSAGGSGVCIDSMGIAVGDLDANGLPDLYCTNSNAPNPLLMSQGGFVFTDSSAAAGVTSSQVGWGAAFFDLELDRDLDLFVVNFDDPHHLFVNVPTWPMTDLATPLGVAGASDISYCMAMADLEGDGDLDLVVQSTPAPVKIFINHNEGAGNWVRFHVLGTGANLFAIGATVAVRTGSEWQRREVRSGTSFKSQDELVLSFGLGTAATIDEVVVRWPWGGTRTLTGLASGQLWWLHPPERMGDPAGNGCDSADIAALFACAGGLVHGCEAYDIDGDSDVDVLDLGILIGQEPALAYDCDASGVPDLIELFLGQIADSDGDLFPDACEVPFLRGDGNGDGIVDVADPIGVLSHLFQGAAAACAAAADANDDHALDIADPVAMLSWLFAGGPAPAAPFPTCEPDTGISGLPCQRGCP